MKQHLLSLLSFSVFFLTLNVVQASHVSGGEITYQYIDSNKYKITLNLYRDCSGIDMSNSETFNFRSSCNSLTITAPLVNPGGTEVSQICPSQIANSTCNGGLIPGMERYTYEAIVTLIPCSDWVISWSTCCRNTTINIPTSSGEGSYFEATLNNIVDSNNISPAFLTQPIPSVCANQLISFNLFASNDDGDSLVFSFIEARSDSAIPLTYDPPYSGSNPINGITLNQSTGEITFTPATLGNFIVVVEVAEYNSSGVLIGTVMRDIQFMVVDCSGNPLNVSPESASGAITNLTGTATMIDSFSLQLCSGGNFSFEIEILDTNSADSVSLTTDIASQLPGAIITIMNGNPATAIISWTDTGAVIGERNFVINANDNVCPVPGVQAYIYSVTVVKSTFTSSDITICGTQAAPLSAGGGSTFQWTSISGDPIIVGTNFSCNPCQNPVATPSSTTTYVVTSDLTGACTNSDTVTVAVTADFTYTKAQSQTAVCKNEDVQFVVSATGTYTYQWTPSSIFNNPAINNPIASIENSGSNTVYFTITNLAGCSRTDSMTVVASSSVKPEVTIIGDTTVCAGSGAQLEASISNSTPATITVGTGSGVGTNTAYPAPYGNWYMGVKHQLLFKASELIALGFEGGEINSIALDVASISGTTVYQNFGIKIGATALNSLSSWQAGLTTVFSPQTVNITTGWNVHNFSIPFNWNGTSNIIVEICFNNQPTAYTNNSPTYYTTTPFTSVIYYNADNNATVCSSPSAANTSSNRPNLRFTTAGAGNGYSYAWSPSYGLDNVSIANPTVTITVDTTYTVIVVDTIGGCSDTADVYLNVVPSFTYSKAQADSSICMNEEIQFVVAPSAGTYTYQWSPAYIFNNSSVSNPIGIFDTAGLKTVYVTISSSAGCEITDSMNVLVSPNVKPEIAIIADTTICSGYGQQIVATIINNSSNGFSYSWSPATGLNNTNVANPFATLTGDTTYTVVVVDTIGGCSDTADIHLVVVPDFTYTKAQSDSGICLNEEVGFIVNPSPGTYIYQWSPAAFLNDSVIPDPIGTFSTSGSHTIYFSISSATGCDKTDSMTVLVSSGVKPDIVITADTTVCSGGTVQLQAAFSNTNPSEIILGTGSSVDGNTTYPAPYGNWYMGVKHQLLFTAAELSALGFNGGPISSLAFDIESISGTTAYQNFEIKMGSTALSSLATWQTGLLTVFPAQTVNIVTGWNVHPFSSNFTWDGTSNIIVEVCFNNQPAGFTNNSPTYYTPTSFNSVIYYNADNNPTVCSSPSGANTSINRPNIKFTVAGAGNGGYSYFWSPATGLDDASVSSPVATLSGDATYTVIVADTIGGCSDTANINLTVVPSFTYSKAQADSSICMNEEIQFVVTPSAGTYTYQWSPAYIFDSSNISNPIGIFDTAGLKTVYVTISSSAGCDITDSMNVLVSPNVKPEIAIIADTTICSGYGQQIVATITNNSSNGFSYSWSPATGLNNTNVANPFATLTSDTTYTVIVVDTIGGCSDTADIHLVVVPDFTYTKAQSDSGICLNEEVGFIVNPSPGTYIYQWSPAAFLNDSVIPDPIGTFSTSGSHTIYFSISSATGCDKTDSMTVLVSSGVKPDIVITADTTVCSGETVQLLAGFSSTAPSEIILGTGTSVATNTAYPAPYGNWYMGVKHQLLFTAAELSALGFDGGPISSLAFDIESISGTTAYQNFEIKMGSTALSSLATWQTGLLTVFPAQTVNIVTGWNVHTFSSNFTWDGTSNIIVEVCFNNQPAGFTNNSPTYYTPTSFNSVIYYNADNNPTVCSSPSGANTSINRPNIKFTVAGAGNGGYSYSWSPATGLDDALISNPVATLNSDATYTVIVADTIGGCSDTANIDLTVVPNFTYAKIQADSSICLYKEVQFVITPSAGTYNYDWSPAYVFDDPSISNPVGSFDTSGLQTVFVTISSTSGCDKTDSMSVIVSPSAVPNIMVVGDSTLCVGGNGTQLNVETNSAGTPCDYRLVMFDSNSDGWDGALLSFYSSGILVNTYTLPTGDSASVTIPIIDGDTLAITFASGAYPYEESYILYNSVGEIVFQDGPIPTNGLAWSGIADCSLPPVTNSIYSWTPSQFLDDDSIANPYASPTGPITYTVIVRDTIGGCADTASVNLTIVPAFTYLTNQSDSLVCLQENVQFIATPSAGSYTYQWSPAGIFNNNTVSNPVATFDSSGSQWVYFTISSSAGCDKSDSMAVFVTSNPKPNIVVYGDFSVCTGSISQLNTSGGGSGYSYDWSPGTGLNDSTIANPIVTPVSNTVYTVIVADTVAFCSDTATVNITMVSLPVINLGADKVFCDTITLNSGSGFASYLWSNGLTTQNILVDISGDYWVKITNSQGCLNSDTINMLDTCSTGLEQHLGLNASLKVYPNPNKGNFTVEIAAISNFENQLRIFNMLGEEIIQKMVLPGRHEFDFKNLGSGIYFLQYSNETGIITRRIVVE